MKNSRNINDLKPYVAYLCSQLISKCKQQGIDLFVTSTVRDQAYQTMLYAQGRTKKGNIVTNAKLIGPHGYGVAFDIVIMVNAKCAWGRSDLFAKAGQIGKSIGLEWAGDWKSFKENCHFQYTGGLSTAQLRAGHLPKFPPVPAHNIAIKDSTPKPILKVIAKCIVTALVVGCYPVPSAKGVSNGKISKGTCLNIYRQVGDWYLVNSTNPQWVKKSFVNIIK